MTFWRAMKALMVLLTLALIVAVFWFLMQGAGLFFLGGLLSEGVDLPRWAALAVIYYLPALLLTAAVGLGFLRAAGAA